jgi:hypothetical protein
MTEAPVSLAERSKACTVYDSLNIEIAGSNPVRGMDVCLRVSVLSCVSVEPCVGLIPQPRSPTKCLWIEKSIKEGQGPIRTVEASGGKKKPFVLLLNECLLLFISLLTQSGNFWIQPRIAYPVLKVKV